MKKTISKRKAEERRALRKQAKKQNTIIVLSLIPPFLASVVFIILYAFKISYAWLSAVTSVLWFAVGGLFIYALTKKWGFISSSGIKTNENSSGVTVYNVILAFMLAVFFLVMTLYKIF